MVQPTGIDVYLLDKEFNNVQAIDDYGSFIWIDRYNAASSFELFCGVDYLHIAMNDYIRCSRSNKIMIVEDRYITTDTELGTQVSITGRSLESILDRRIVWKQTLLTGSLQNGIKKLITEAMISPTDTNRKIDNFIFIDSTDQRILDMKLEVQLTGDNLYDAVVVICDIYEIGYSILFNEETGNIEFRLYMGEDRSIYQTTHTQIAFSPSLNNLLESNYSESISQYKNVALIAGEGDGIDRKTNSIGDSSGLGRYELFVDARDISSYVDDIVLTPEEYNDLLKSRGESKLIHYPKINDFEAEVENTPQVDIGKDVFLGDVVHVENEYGQTAKTRMVEIIIADDTQNGFTMIPTFKEDNK